MPKTFALFLYFVFQCAITVTVTAQGVNFSGISDSTVSLRAGAGDTPDFSYSVEQYVNLRMQARIRDRAVFFGALNLTAAAGDTAYAMQDLSGFFIGGKNYVAGIELERLFFRINGETASLDGGLLRIPFGYSHVWGSTDFLNPPNPLQPDARPRGVLGGVASWFPRDSLKLVAFGVALRDPLSPNGSGGLFGISADRHWSRASMQALYSFESPQTDSERGIHRAGVSVKADLEIELVLEALYTYNHEKETGTEGLSLSFGANYSFFGGDLIILAEYLYNGATSSTALGYGGSFTNENYMYTGLSWRFSDFTNMSAALISGFDDISFTPVISLNHEVFQGATLTVSAQIPLDRDTFSNNGKHGELGPRTTRNHFNSAVRLRLRF